MWMLPLKMQSLMEFVLTDCRRAAVKDLFLCLAGLLNSVDAGVRRSWEDKASSLAVIKAAKEWGSEDAAGAKNVDWMMFSVKTMLIGLSNAVRAGAIPAQGQVVLLS